MVTSSCRIARHGSFTGSVLPTALRALWLAAAAAMLVACGGGSGDSGTGAQPPSTGSPSNPPPSNPPPSNPPPASKGTVVVRAITTTGMPVRGMSVGFNGVGQGRSATTDANGEASFKDVPAGDGSAHLGGSGYHYASRGFTVADGSETRLTVSLQGVTEAVPVLLATYPAKPSADGQTLTVEVDLAVLAADGSSRADLVAGDFLLEGGCGWYVCVSESDGRDTYAGYRARATAASFNAAAVPPAASSAVGVLIEQSETMGTFDPQGLRLQATRDYFDRVLPPNLVAFASQRDTGTTPILTTYGGFTSDGSQFRKAIDGLRGQEAGSSRMLGAIAEMAGFMKSGLSNGAGSPRQAMVVMATWEEGCPDRSSPLTCASSLQSALEAAQAAGVSVIAAGPRYSLASAVALGTGGASAAIEDPSQWPVLFRALDPLVAGGLPRYRVRLELDAGAPGVFIKGRFVRGELVIRIGTDTQLYLWDLSMPI